MDNNQKKEVLVEIKDLKTYFTDKDGIIYKILDGVNLQVYKGKTLGIMGYSGVGKSVLAVSILNLIKPPGKIVEGEIIYKGKNLLEMEEEDLNDLRGREISLVLQNNPGSFDPLVDMTFATSQPYKAHIEEDPIKSEIKMLVVDQLGKVALPDPLTTSDKFAHQVSGGEGQRVKIATAVINNPTLLIADEPVSNLDTTIAAEIIELLKQMKERFNLTMILIAHNLGVIAELSEYVALLYAGNVVEFGDVESIFYNPRHPYTQGLFYATPSMAARGKLRALQGVEPDPKNYPSGCRFHPRCKYAIDKCLKENPSLEVIENKDDHLVACWRMNDIPKYEAEY